MFSCTSRIGGKHCTKRKKKRKPFIIRPPHGSNSRPSIKTSQKQKLYKQPGFRHQEPRPPDLLVGRPPHSNELTGPDITKGFQKAPCLNLYGSCLSKVVYIVPKKLSLIVCVAEGGRHRPAPSVCHCFHLPPQHASHNLHVANREWLSSCVLWKTQPCIGHKL